MLVPNGVHYGGVPLYFPHVLPLRAVHLEGINNMTHISSCCICLIGYTRILNFVQQDSDITS